MGDETKIVIRNLSPDAWEALKWTLTEKFRPITLKDKNKDGHYETGEAQQAQGDKTELLTGPLLIEFEKEVASYDCEDLENFEKDGKALQAILEGKCHQQFRCSAEELKDHERHLLDGDGEDNLGSYASLLQEKFPPEKTRPITALIVGEALFAKGELEAARPYYERAKTIVNEPRIKNKLAIIAFEAKDWDSLRGLLEDDVVKRYVSSHIGRTDFKADEGDEKLQQLLKDYPEVFKVKIKLKEAGRKEPPPARREEPAPKAKTGAKGESGWGF